MVSCKVEISKNEQRYEERMLVNDIIKTVAICKSCKDEIYSCVQCGVSRTYCNECV